MTGVSYPKVWLDEHGIIRIGWGRGKIKLADMHCAHQRHLAISTLPQPVLVYAECGDTMSIEWAALDYAASQEVAAITSASALLVSSFMQQHFARMFLWYHSPPYPARIFRKETEAIDWLTGCLPADRISGSPINDH